jgi:hypothetical protein
MRKRTGRLRWAIAGVAALAVLGGCSQVQQLQPVAGDAISGVRIATMDVLADKGVKVMVSPVCTADGDLYQCLGKAADGSPIEASGKEIAAYGATLNQYGVPADAVVDLSVSVAGKQIYQGKVDEVLNRAGQVTR